MGTRQEKETKTRARPKKIINQKQFESLCAIQCTEEEICAVLDVCNDTLDTWCMNTYKKRFSTVFREKRVGGKASLRRMQWKLAETNPSMAIFLGKNMLGQSDRPEQENTADKIIQGMATLIESMSKIEPNRSIEDLEN